LSLIHSNKISDTFRAVDTSGSSDAIINVSLKGKKKYIGNLIKSDDDNLGYIRYYDEIFDFKLRGSTYTCAVLKCQTSSLSLDDFIKNGIEKNVFFFLRNL
jgi:hypothetical protein